MTIVIGLAPGRKGHAALHLGAVLARSSVEDVVVCTVVKAPWPPDPLQGDREYLALADQAAQHSLDHARDYLGSAPLAAEYVVRRAPSAAAGLLEVVGERPVSTVVLGSSSAGMLGHVMLGGVAERILHGAELPVAVAPRGFHDGPVTEVARVSVAFGRADHDSELLVRAARAARDVSATLRVVCFAVRPMARYSEAVEPGAEQAVVGEWVAGLEQEVSATLAAVAEPAAADVGAAVVTRVETVLGTGTSWDEALHDVAWGPGDVLAVGTSTGPFSRFFLGSHAAKIVRNSPVPVVLLPRAAAAAGPPS